MSKVNMDQIAETISEGIGGAMGDLFHAFKKGEPASEEKWVNLENSLAWAVAKVLFEATNNGVTDIGFGEGFKGRRYYPETAIASHEDNSHNDLRGVK